MMNLATIHRNSKCLIRQILRQYVVRNRRISFSGSCSRLIHARQHNRHTVISQKQIDEGHYKKKELPIELWASVDSRILYNSLEANAVITDPTVLYKLEKKVKLQEHLARRRRAIPLIIEQSVVISEEEDDEYTDSDSDEEHIEPTTKSIYPYAREHQLDITESSLFESDPNMSESLEQEGIAKYQVPVEEEIALRMKAYDEGILEELDTPKGNIIKDENIDDLMDAFTEEDEDFVIRKEQHGSADPTLPVSDVPCGGCGAFLHCQQPSLMGFVPKELFVGRDAGQLRSVFCQRCHFLRVHNTALNVRVDPEMYVKLLQPIKNKKALVLLVVDLLDVPCSIWPNIMDIIGTRRPVVVVGNKVDLLPADGKNHLHKVKSSLVAAIEKTPLSQADIKHLALVSAHTGYGIESLITKIQKSWATKGDIYILGCTNSGKSTLFNALLGSDMCKTAASSLIRRATVSPWPGTTLNMLKFPVLRPSGHRLYLRVQRLREQQKMQPRRKGPSFTKNVMVATLSGHIGRTFEKIEEPVVKTDPFATDMMKLPVEEPKPIMGINPSHKPYLLSKWCYDTPGTVQPQQLINLLTHEELMRVLPNRLLRPRSFCLQSGHSLLIGGLVRLDLLHSPHSVRFTVFRSARVPLTVCKTVDAAAVYRQYLGSPILGVPTGGEERLQKWPALQPVNLRAYSHNHLESCVDVVLSSAGWVSLTATKHDQLMELRAWSPGSRGIHLRDPPLLPRAINLRGRRIGKSLAYRRHKMFVPQT